MVVITEDASSSAGGLRSIVKGKDVCMVAATEVVMVLDDFGAAEVDLDSVVDVAYDDRSKLRAATTSGADTYAVVGAADVVGTEGVGAAEDPSSLTVTGSSARERPALIPRAARTWKRATSSPLPSQ